ncbi:hypothetical protein E2C01_045062 [Portunus trituberculatus]|uniref:Uncharacterized protein n=1 Tax=Portunus trituberculatus TaxID=210409 RepID=A0A5B7G125_PORTR|nr:hypothetical protein [Portunus trituberculatus]
MNIYMGDLHLNDSKVALEALEGRVPCKSSSSSAAKCEIASRTTPIVLLAAALTTQCTNKLQKAICHMSQASHHWLLH